MVNIINDGNVIQFTNSTGSKISSGAVVVIGKFCGVAMTNIENGATGSVSVKGQFILPKKTKTDVIAVGDQLVYDSGIKVISAATTLPIVRVGYATKASTATEETVNVLLG